MLRKLLLLVILTIFSHSSFAWGFSRHYFSPRPHFLPHHHHLYHFNHHTPHGKHKTYIGKTTRPVHKRLGEHSKHKGTLNNVKVAHVPRHSLSHAEKYHIRKTDHDTRGGLSNTHHAPYSRLRKKTEGDLRHLKHSIK